MKKQTAEILLQSKIKFVMGMSEDWGADCVGLIVLKHKLEGLDYSWEVNIPRKIMSFERFQDYLLKCDCVQDEKGDIGLVKYPRHAHLGLIYKDLFISQCNIVGETVVSKIPADTTRFSYRPSKLK